MIVRILFKKILKNKTPTTHTHKSSATGKHVMTWCVYIMYLAVCRNAGTEIRMQECWHRNKNSSINFKVKEKQVFRQVQHRSRYFQPVTSKIYKKK